MALKEKPRKADHESKSQEKLKLSPIDDFIKFEKEIVEGKPFLLPVSNLVISVSSPDLESLVLSGDMPIDILELITKTKNLDLDDLTPSGDKIPKTEELKKIYDFLNDFFEKVVKYPTKDQFDYSRFPFADKLAVFQMFQDKGVQGVKSFR